MKNPALSLLLFSLISSFASAQATGTLANLSSRGLVGQTSGSLIAGFVVQGDGAKTILVRGVGPGLGEFGVGNASTGVGIKVYDSTGALVASNSGFQNDPDSTNVQVTAASVGAFPLSDAGDSELLVSLPAGGYTLEVSAADSDSPDGAALLEVYDADAPGTANSKLVNLSTRGQVGATAGTLIAGFVVTGDAPKSMLIRGIGQDLAQFGLTNTAADVSINVYDASGTLIASNNGFKNDPDLSDVERVSDGVGAFPLTSPGGSAMVISLTPGSYTVQVAPNDPQAADGAGLVEVYDADSMN